MWQTRTVYDANLHARNQLKHGSWVWLAARRQGCAFGLNL
jgi:hypothetical protein